MTMLLLEERSVNIEAEREEHMGGGVGGESTGCKTETYAAFWTIRWLVDSILYVLDQKKKDIQSGCPKI